MKYYSILHRRVFVMIKAFAVLIKDFVNHLEMVKKSQCVFDQILFTDVHVCITIVC